MKLAIDAISRIMFLDKVSPFVSLKASPKQPQSTMLLVMYKYNVRGVITSIITIDSSVEIFLLIPQNSSKPIVSSKADIPTAKNKETKECIFVTPNTAKYSCILYCTPTGSTALANPDKMNVNERTNLLMFTEYLSILFRMLFFNCKFYQCKNRVVYHVHIVGVNTF